MRGRSIVVVSHDSSALDELRPTLEDACGMRASFQTFEQAKHSLNSSLSKTFCSTRSEATWDGVGTCFSA